MGIRNVAALKETVAGHTSAALDDVVRAINITLELSVTADNKATKVDSKAKDHRAEAGKHRLEAGRMLLDLRRRVEAENGDWWKWQKGKFTRGRKDIEKIMRLAKADDPEAAAATEREKNRARDNARNAAAREDGARSCSKSQPVSSKPDPPAPTDAIDIVVEDALRLVRQMTDHQRHDFMAKLKEEFS